jgi:hypothetical protein
MVSPAVPAAGVYYLTASLTIEVDTGDTVGCEFAPTQAESTSEQVGPSANDTFDSMTLSGATTQFGEDGLNAVLISNSSGAVSSTATPGNTHRPLKV